MRLAWSRAGPGRIGPRVAGSSGVCGLTVSQRANDSANPADSTPSPAASAASAYGAYSSTSKSRGRSSSMTRRLTSEADTMPTVRP